MERHQQPQGSTYLLTWNDQVREFLPVLILKVDIKQFRVTPHVNRNHQAGLAMSKAVSAELVEIVAARNKKGGKKGGKKKAKK